MSDYGRSRDFYAEALKPLGMNLLMEPVAGVGGFGRAADQKPFFWIAARGGPVVERTRGFRHRQHRGGRCLPRCGARRRRARQRRPGKREIYHPGYYGAYVLDPDGNNIEAVCHTAGSA